MLEQVKWNNMTNTFLKEYCLKKINYQIFFDYHQNQLTPIQKKNQNCININTIVTKVEI